MHLHDVYLLSAMVPISAQQGAAPQTAKTICRIVGLTCLAGFAIDMLALGLPPNPLDIQWRIGFLQQMGDRSIVLFLGVALTMFGYMESRKILRQLAMFSLIAGIVFQLSCILVLRDSLTAQNVAVNTIRNQASQLQTQIKEAEQNPSAAPDITPEQLRQASDLITGRAEELKQNARTGLLRTGLASMGNLIIIGLGLISLGRFGLRLRRKG